MKDLSPWHVYLVTDRALCRGRDLETVVRAAVRGGVSAVQLREKHTTTREVYEQALALKPMLTENGVALIINDRVDIALAVDADGVHLGRTDLPAPIARRLLGPDKIIGLSVNDYEHLTDEAAAYADYLALSPLFHTLTKEDITPPWGLDGLPRARALTGKPLVVIGGLNAGNSRSAAGAGADCAAVVSAIVSADNPREATEILVREVREGKKLRRQSN